MTNRSLILSSVFASAVCLALLPGLATAKNGKDNGQSSSHASSTASSKANSHASTKAATASSASQAGANKGSDTTEAGFFHDIRHLDFPFLCLTGVSFFRHVCDLNLTCCPIVAETWHDCARIPVISRSCCDNLWLCLFPDDLSKKTG